jgi:hypothetical protein
LDIWNCSSHFDFYQPLFNPVNSGILKSNYSEFKSFIENKQVRKVEVINKKRSKSLYYNEQLDTSPHIKTKTFLKKVFLEGLTMDLIMFLTSQIMKVFQLILEEAQKEYAYSNKTLMYDYVEEDNFGKDILDGLYSLEL